MFTLLHDTLTIIQGNYKNIGTFTSLLSHMVLLISTSICYTIKILIKYYEQLRKVIKL